jgi:hypothetical protein
MTLKFENISAISKKTIYPQGGICGRIENHPKQCHK